MGQRLVAARLVEARALDRHAGAACRLGHDEEVALHVRATANTGASREDICEAFLHVAIYAGVPAANRAIKVAKEVFAELDAQAEGRDDR